MGFTPYDSIVLGECDSLMLRAKKYFSNHVSHHLEWDGIQEKYKINY
jgi:hypothetical protein